jgi:hypothetical protein
VIPDAPLDQLLAGGDPRAALQSDGLIDSLKKALAESMVHGQGSVRRHLRRALHQGDGLTMLSSSP